MTEDPRALAARNEEVWAPVPGTAYEASNLGRVRNPKTGRIVGTCRLKSGYFSLPGLLVHRAVLSAFDGPRPPNIVARHGNSDRGDNRLTNLSWGTRAENAEDAMLAGRLRGRNGAPVAAVDKATLTDIVVSASEGRLSHKDAAKLAQRSEGWVQMRVRRLRNPVVQERSREYEEDEARSLAARGVEVWVPAVGIGGFEVSNLGKVRSATTKNLWSAHFDRRAGGYLRVEGAHLHRLVLTSFSDEPSPCAVVRHHPDPDRANCALHNLCWGTYADNGSDTVSHGRTLRGGTHPRAVLTDARVEEGLRLFAESAWTTSQLSDFLGGIGQGNASDIVTGASWGHVARPEGLESRRGRVGSSHHLSHLDDASVAAGLALAAEQGWGAVRLGRHLGVKTATGSQILAGKTWTHLPLPAGYEKRRAGRVLKQPEADQLTESHGLLGTLFRRLEALTLEVSEGRHKLEDAENVLTREELILVTREAGAVAVETEILPRVTTLLQEHVRVWGWFYPSDARGLADALRVVRGAGGADAVLSSRTQAGTSFLHARFHSFWDVDGGPAVAFAKPSLLRNVLRYRLGLNNSKDYTYTLSTGEVVQTRETFDIALKNVRRGFVVQRQTVSFFKPSVACSIYRKWVSGTDAPVVWDASCGFGARLLGFSAAFPRGVYLGNEPATKTHRDVVALAADLLAAGELAGAAVLRVGSEVEAPFGEAMLDLVFTSPPYFNLEKYYDEPGQCWKDHPTEAEWYEHYLLPTVAAAFVGLKAGCCMVINVDARCKPLVLRAAEEVGFVFEQEDALVLGSDHFARKREDTVERGEPVLVFRKSA